MRRMCKREVEEQKESDRYNLQREAWIFSLLFIYSFISAGSLSLLRGQRCDEGMCFLGT